MPFSAYNFRYFNRLFKLFGTTALAVALHTPIAAETLTVALYPFVPRVEQFETAISKAWLEVQPDVSLNFLPTDRWDGGYAMDPPNDADVYVFDAMFLQQFTAQGNLIPFAPDEISDLDDFLPYAITAARSGETYLAIPLLGCANILFYDKNDAELAAATTLSEVAQALNQCTYTSIIPPDRRGIMLDMAGGTTNAALYLDIAHAENGTLPLPQPDPGNLAPSAIGAMRLLLATASYYNATATPADAYQRSAWFSQGYGRAVVGFSESMSDMSAETLASIAFKVMPLSDDPSNPPLFYSDMIAVNATTANRGTTALAKQFANVMAQSATVVASFTGTPQNPTPQYLMPARTSVFGALSPDYPIYGQMLALTQTNPVLFGLNAEARSWVGSVKGTIKTETLSGYQCGCDFKSEPISSNAAAPAICEPLCALHGGWNGNWTNQPPVDGSVCQCNTCPIPGNVMADVMPTARMTEIRSDAPRPTKP